MLRGMSPSAVWGPMTTLLEPLTAGAADVDPVEAACDGVEVGGEDDEVEGELALGRPEAGRRDALDGDAGC